MSATAGPITLYSQWCSTRKDLSLAISAFNCASKTLSSLDRRLSALHESILQGVEEELSGLHSEVDQFLFTVAGLKMLRNSSVTLAPINRLPAEILASIFGIAVHDSHIPRPRPETLDAPKWVDFTTVLAGVSQYWRQVALSTPALWSYIDLDTRGQLEYQTLWLERSRDQLLDIRFRAGISERFLGNKYQMHDIVLPHLHRCRSLCLAMETSLGQEILRRACISRRVSSPNLHSLTLFTRGIFSHSFSDAEAPPPHGLEQFLRSVRTLHLYFTGLGTWTPTAFRNLTELTLHSISRAPTSRQLVEILQAATDLRTLRLSSLTMTPPSDLDIAQINLEKLETLSLRSLLIPFAYWLLGLLVPQPEGLTLLLDYGYAYSNETRIGLDLPLPAPDRIKVFYVCNLPQGNLNLHQLLLFMPKLESLAFHDVRLEWTRVHTSGTNFQHPQLRVLDLVNCSTGRMPDFVDVLKQHSVDQLRMYECDSVPSVEGLRALVPGLIISEEPGDFITEVSWRDY